MIPDQAQAHVNYRYAPGRTPEEAEARLHELCDGHGELRIDANAPSGAVGDRPARRRADRRRRPGDRAQAGLDAGGRVRRGAASRRSTSAPATRRRRTRASESISVAALVRCYRVLERFAAGAVKPSPVLTGLRTYPFVRLTDAKRELLARGVPVDRLRDRRAARGHAGVHPRGARGGARAELDLPARRGAAGAARGDRGLGRAALRPGARPGHRGDPDARLQGGDLPPRPGRRRRPRGGHRPAYPVAERGAAFAGKQVVELPLAAERGFLPDLDAVDAATWERTAILWLNYPNNPTAATAPLELYEQAAAIAREHDVVLASDEAYSEIYFGPEPPVSALQVADRRNVIAFNTLSKRSSMPGYRSGFVAGDPEVIAALKRYRPERRRRAAGVHPARRRRRVGRRGARRGRARALPRQARRAAAGASRPPASATPAATRRSSSGSTPASAPTRWPPSCSSAASCSRPARSSARPARATCASRSCRRSTSASARPSCSRQSLACRAALRPRPGA